MPAAAALTRARALLAGICRSRTDRFDVEEHLLELELLAETAGAQVVGRVIQDRGPVHPATLFRRGKIDEMALRIGEDGAGLVICDEDLSPAQVRNLESALKVRVLDR